MLPVADSSYPFPRSTQHHLLESTKILRTIYLPVCGKVRFFWLLCFVRTAVRHSHPLLPIPSYRNN